MEEVYEVHKNSEDATAGRRRRKRRSKRAKDKKRAKSKRRPRRRRRTKRAAAQPAMYQHPPPTVYPQPIGASAYATSPLAPTAQPAAAARWDAKTGKDMNSAIDADKEPEKLMTQRQMQKALVVLQARVKEEETRQPSPLQSPAGQRSARESPVARAPVKSEYMSPVTTPVSQPAHHRTSAHGSASRTTPQSVQAIDKPMSSKVKRIVESAERRSEEAKNRTSEVEAEIARLNKKTHNQKTRAATARKVAEEGAQRPSRNLQPQRYKETKDIKKGASKKG